MLDRHAVVELPTLGRVTLVARGGSMTGLFFKHHHPAPRVPFGERVRAENDRTLRRAENELREYLLGDRRTFDVPLLAAGDVFDEVVWSEIQRVPFGTTTTYGEVAERLGDRHLAQDVGQALARNPLCVFNPCHRVISANGSLTGYAGGVPIKQDLLDLEQRAIKMNRGGMVMSSDPMPQRSSGRL